MVLSVEAVRSLASTIAVMCLLAVAYGTVARASWPRLFPWVMGLLFGAAAVMALFNPVRIGDGVQADLRGVPIVLAGAYLGWRGVTAAAGLAIAMRLGIGGVGMVGGCAGIVINALAGLAWAGLMRRTREAGSRCGLRAMAGLGGLSSTYLLTALLLPIDLAWRFVATVWPVLLPLHVLGVLVVGSVLERERVLLEEQRRLTEAADRDPLTGLLNRRGFEAATERARPEFTGSAVLLLDLDRFKRVNDVHGHAAGDAVLRELGQRLIEALGSRGALGRLGGEEIAVFLPSILPREMEQVAERLRHAVRRTLFVLPSDVRLLVTVSIGGAWSPGPLDLGTLVDRADQALYVAKGGGRDRCCLDPDRPAPEPAPVPEPALAVAATPAVRQWSVAA